MLNYVWISLIVIGLLVAAGNDIKDEAQNTYRNGVALHASLVLQKAPSALRATWEGDLVLSADAFNEFYGIKTATAEIVSTPRAPIVRAA